MNSKLLPLLITASVIVTISILPYAVAQTSESSLEDVLDKLQSIQTDVTMIKDDQVTILLNQQNLANSQESFYQISGGVTNAEAIGVYADCSGISDSECIFGVDSVRYSSINPASINVFGICIDNVNFGSDNLSNCSPFLQDLMELDKEMGLAVEFPFSAKLGYGGKATIDTSSGPEWGWSSTLTLKDSLTVPLSAPEGVKADFDGEAVGGNVLVDGDAQSLATKYVILRNSQFTGDVEFLGEKPVIFDLIFGYVNNDDNTTCVKADGTAVSPCPTEFADALKNTAFEPPAPPPPSGGPAPRTGGVDYTMPSAESSVTYVDYNEPESSLTYVDSAEAQIIPVVLGSSGSIADILARQQGALDSLGSVTILFDQININQIDSLLDNLNNQGLPQKSISLLTGSLSQIETLLNTVLGELGTLDLRSVMTDIDTTVGELKSAADIDVSAGFSGVVDGMFSCQDSGFIREVVVTEGFVCTKDFGSCQQSGTLLLDGQCQLAPACNSSDFPDRNADNICFGDVICSIGGWNVGDQKCSYAATVGCDSGWKKESAFGLGLICTKGATNDPSCSPPVCTPTGCVEVCLPIGGEIHCDTHLHLHDPHCSSHFHSCSDVCTGEPLCADPVCVDNFSGGCPGGTDPFPGTSTCTADLNITCPDGGSVSGSRCVANPTCPAGGSIEVVLGLKTGKCLDGGATCSSPYGLKSDNLCRYNLCGSATHVPLTTKCIGN